MSKSGKQRPEVFWYHEENTCDHISCMSLRKILAKSFKDDIKSKGKGKVRVNSLSVVCLR